VEQNNNICTFNSSGLLISGSNTSLSWDIPEQEQEFKLGDLVRIKDFTMFVKYNRNGRIVRCNPEEDNLPVLKDDTYKVVEYYAPMLNRRDKVSTIVYVIQSKTYPNKQIIVLGKNLEKIDEKLSWDIPNINEVSSIEEYIDTVAPFEIWLQIYEDQYCLVWMGRNPHLEGNEFIEGANIEIFVDGSNRHIYPNAVEHDYEFTHMEASLINAYKMGEVSTLDEFVPFFNVNREEIEEIILIHYDNMDKE